MALTLEQLGIPADISKQLQEARAQELEVEDTGGNKFPEFEAKPGEAKTISILPGGSGSVDWVKYAHSQLDVTDIASIKKWIEEKASEQVARLGCGDDVPSYGKIPAGYPAAVAVSGLFMPKLGRVSYAKYPAAVLEKLPPEHPRRLALTIKGKFGANKIKQGVLLYCIEHPLNKRGLDDSALEQQIRDGGFVKLLHLNKPSYQNLKDAKAAAVQMGKQELPSIHLVVSVQDAQFNKLGFQVNALQTPAWHKPELLRLVLQEIERLGPVASKNPYREVTDQEFADAVKQALASAQQEAPQA